jgi:hypothetical protein
MSENRFPNSQFKLVKEIWNDDLKKIESMFGELLRKGVLNPESTKSMLEIQWRLVKKQT